MGGEPRWGKMGKIKDICQPNNDAVIINMINMAMKEVRPKWAPTTMLLPYNQRLLPLMGQGGVRGLARMECGPRWWIISKNKTPNNTAVIIRIDKNEEIGTLKRAPTTM